MKGHLKSPLSTSSNKHSPLLVLTAGLIFYPINPLWTGHILEVWPPIFRHHFFERFRDDFRLSFEMDSNWNCTEFHFSPNDHLIGIWGDFEVIWNQLRLPLSCQGELSIWISRKQTEKTFWMWIAWLSLYLAKFKRIQEVRYAHSKGTLEQVLEIAT